MTSAKPRTVGDLLRAIDAFKSGAAREEELAVIREWLALTRAELRDCDIDDLPIGSLAIDPYEDP